MIKEIRYSGYSAVPSDYECKDGQLAGMINLIPEDGTLKPVFPPKPILDCNLGGKVQLIHRVPGQDNYIIMRHDDELGLTKLFYMEKKEKYQSEEDAEPIATFIEMRDIAIVGNTLVVATDTGLRYILWKDGHYTSLPGKPQFVPISFGMTKMGTLSDSQELDIEFKRIQGGGGVGTGTGKVADTEENTNAVYGLLLSAIKEKVTSKGFFYMPFFVRYAYRLYDGSYSWHSAPVLMLPSVIPPVIKVGEYEIGEESHADVPSTLDVPFFSLDYRILPDSATEGIADWSDLIAGIDIFISAPIYTYDQSKRVEGIRDTSHVLLNAYYDWNPDGLTDTSAIKPAEVFTGHYADIAIRGGGDGTNDTGVYVDHCMSTSTDASGYSPAWVLPLNEHFHDNIKEVSQFYKIASIDIKDIEAMTAYKRLKFESTVLDSLVARPTLEDDYQSHCSLDAEYLLTYNSRLNLAHVSLTPAKPFCLPSCVQATGSSSPKGYVAIKVYTRLNGVMCMSERQSLTTSDMWDLENTFPRYLYYPDASAYKMSLKVGDRETVVDLTPSDFLNGAYWYGTFAKDTKPESAKPETREAKEKVSLDNKIYTSEVNNPFKFPVAGINTVGTGTVLGISTAAKALSQGQFGQFPLYAFTTDGVWALELSSSGFFSARQPITRDVCTNAGGITQIDSAVLFPTSRGLMLLQGSTSVCLSDPIGTEAPFSPSALPHFDELAGNIGMGANQTTYPSFSSFLKKCRIVYDYLHQRIIVCGDSSGCAYVYSLKSKEWGMMANVVESAVDSYPEALAMSHDGKLVDFSRKFVGWNYSSGSLYPDISGITHGTSLELLTGIASSQAPVAPASAEGDEEEESGGDEGTEGSGGAVTTPLSLLRTKGLLVTRPLKLDAPDVLKTVDTVIQRGKFRKGHVQCVLYGSRDLFHWHTVWSSRDHYLRGFRGTPYKYFRLACLTDFAEDESLFGASVQFTPRLTDQLR